MDPFMFWLAVILLVLIVILVFVLIMGRGWNYPAKTEIRDGESGRISDCNIRRVHLRVVYLERRVTELEREIAELKKRLGES